MKKRELYKITAYHCAHCGAPTRPDRDLCDWCAQKVLLKHYQEKRNLLKSKVRVLVESGGNYINFDQIVSLDGLSTAPEQIDVTSGEDKERHFISGRQTLDNWSFTMYQTQRSCELSSKLKREKDYNIRIETLEEDMAFEYSATFLIQTMPYMNKNELIKFELVFVPKDIKGMIDTIVPKDMTCPNCGAPINSRLGTCIYCGGWVEFEF